jgi:large subunit ribosomal protein L25
MDTIVIKATRRSVTGKHVKNLRRQGLLPAVLYGHNFESVPIVLDAHSTAQILSGLSASTIINVELEGEQHAALVREKQRDYLKNRLLHLDFQVVSLTEKIRAAVNITLTGTAPAVREMNAVLVSNLNTVMVEALPRDLPETISVDISSLKVIGDAIHIRDLEVPATVEILADMDEMVVVATGVAAEEEEEVEEVAEETEPEVLERGKKEEDEEE